MNEAHHWGWIGIVLFTICLVAYIWSVNRPDNTNYGKDATHNEQHRQDWPFSIHLGEGSCAHFSTERILAKPEKKK